MARRHAALFGGAPDSLTLSNPIAADLDQMRPTPLATLALAAARNVSRGAGQADVFEVGPAYAETGQTMVAAGLRSGAPARHWQARTTAEPALLAKADVWALLAEIGVPLEALSVTRDAPAHYHPGQSATLRQGPRVLGWFGALHPAVLAALDLPGQSCGFEVLLDAVADPKRRRRTPPDLAMLQPVLRDFAFLVPSDMPAETVLRAARSADRNLIARVALFDVFEGGSLPAGQKSLGLEVTLQPRERTLTEQDIEAVCKKVVDGVVKASGAQLR